MRTRMCMARSDPTISRRQETYMKVRPMTLKPFVCVLVVAACAGIVAAAPNAGAAQAPGAAQAVPAAPGTAQAPGRGRGPQPVDPRVQIRMHHFAETNQ